jgi:hypothetical protein
LEANGGLESISSFLMDEKFFKQHLKSVMKTFGKPKERVLRLLIANLSALSQVDDLFTNKSQELIEFMFKFIKISEITSDLAFSAYLFLLKNCNGDQIEANGQLKVIFAKIAEYLEKCAEDFQNKSKETLDQNRESRDLKIGGDVYKCKFYSLDIDNSGIRTALKVILDSLSFLGTKTNLKQDIYDKFKSDLYIILEKGKTGEKRLVLDIYGHLAKDAEVCQNMKEKIKQIKSSFLQSSDYERKLKNPFEKLLNILGINLEPKESIAHDIAKISN